MDRLETNLGYYAVIGTIREQPNITLFPKTDLNVSIKWHALLKGTVHEVVDKVHKTISP